jgi:hypothetical protein
VYLSFLRFLSKTKQKMESESAVLESDGPGGVNLRIFRISMKRNAL